MTVHFMHVLEDRAQCKLAPSQEMISATSVLCRNRNGDVLCNLLQNCPECRPRTPGWCKREMPLPPRFGSFEYLLVMPFRGQMEPLGEHSSEHVTGGRL